MKRILVPIDFSEHSEYAVKAAARIARKSGGKIYLLHMINFPPNEMDMSVRGDLSNAAKVFYLEQIHEKFRDFKRMECIKGVSVSEEVRFHKTFSGIIDYAHELNSDLIVMGSQGATGLKEIFIGSNTEKVVRSSDIPVLVVKKGVEDFGMNKFVFASNFANNIKPSFERFLEFAAKFDAEIHLLYVNTVHNFEPTKKTRKRFREFLSDFKLPKHTINIYNDTSIEKGILNFAKEIKADIIALNTHQRSGLSSMFNESIS